jgi:hypothetical protein
MRFYQFEQIVRDMIPSVYEHLQNLNIQTHMYASQWFLTLYTSKFPLYMVYRIIDLFLYHGFNVRLASFEFFLDFFMEFSSKGFVYDRGRSAQSFSQRPVDVGF